MIPSLGIILTEKCNFRCVYCPPHGENMSKTTTELCDLQSLCDLIEISATKDVKVVRFTGGEPLIFPERLKTLLKKASECNFEKIILNTNGYFLKEHIHWLKEYKTKFLLKISLDTVNERTFSDIVRVPNVNIEKVLEAIRTVKEYGFNIEINTVANKYNKRELLDVITYCQENDLNLKIFDLFDFGDSVVDYNDIYCSLDSLIDELKALYQNITPERLPGNRGIEMQKFKLTNNSHLLVVSHKGKYSSTKSYTEECKVCYFFPCACGKFQIPIRADGLMQTCRVNPNCKKANINGLSYGEIDESFSEMLQEFELITII